MASITQTLLQSLMTANPSAALGASIDPLEKSTVTQDDEEKQLAEAKAHPFDFGPYAAKSMIPENQPLGPAPDPMKADVKPSEAVPYKPKLPATPLGPAVPKDIAAQNHSVDMYGDDLSDRAMKEAASARDNDLFMANMSRAMNSIGAALGRGKVEANNTVNDAITKGAGQKLEDIKSRRSGKDQEVSRELNLSKVANERDLADPNSEISMGMRDQAAKYGLKLGPNVAAREAEKLIENARHWSEMQLRAQALKDAKAERDQNKKDKADLALQERKVSDFDIKPGYRPTSKDAEEVKAANAARKDILFEMQGLRDLVAKNGPEVGFGEARDRMMQRIENISMKLKDVEKLGALAGPDVAALRRQIPDPTSLDNWIKAGATGKLGQRFDMFEQSLNQSVNNAADSRGYAVPGSKALATPPPLGGTKAKSSLDAEKAAGSESRASGPHGPFVVQNGHRYDWNAETGQYE